MQLIHFLLFLTFDVWLFVFWGELFFAFFRCFFRLGSRPGANRRYLLETVVASRGRLCLLEDRGEGGRVAEKS